jgi:hypothetical protein
MGIMNDELIMKNDGSRKPDNNDNNDNLRP